MTWSNRLLIGGLLACALPQYLIAQKTWPVDFFVMPEIQNARRHFVNAGATDGADNLSLKGIEAQLVGQGSAVGIGARYLIAMYKPNSKFRDLTGTVFIGDKTFRLEAAYTQRTFIPLDTTLTMARAGFSSTVHIGASGVALRIHADYDIPIKRFTGKGAGPFGWDGETSVSYTWNRFPIFAQLGYRLEHVHAMQWNEDVSALTLGAGFWLWGK